MCKIFGEECRGAYLNRNGFFSFDKDCKMRQNWLLCWIRPSRNGWGGVLFSFVHVCVLHLHVQHISNNFQCIESPPPLPPGESPPWDWPAGHQCKGGAANFCFAKVRMPIARIGIFHYSNQSRKEPITILSGFLSLQQWCSFCTFTAQKIKWSLDGYHFWSYWIRCFKHRTEISCERKAPINLMCVKERTLFTARGQCKSENCLRSNVRVVTDRQMDGHYHWNFGHPSPPRLSSNVLPLKN